MIFWLLLWIVTIIDPAYVIFFSSLWSICTVYLQLSDLDRLIHGSLSIEEIQRIKLRSIQIILLNLVAILVAIFFSVQLTNCPVNLKNLLGEFIRKSIIFFRKSIITTQELILAAFAIYVIRWKIFFFLRFMSLGGGYFFLQFVFFRVKAIFLFIIINSTKKSYLFHIPQ